MATPGTGLAQEVRGAGLLMNLECDGFGTIPIFANAKDGIARKAR
jgi:hypothetical protein